MITFLVHGRLRKRWEIECSGRVASALVGEEFRVLFTEAAGQAAVLGHEAAACGAAAVVAVGGDGMLNEVVNGIMQWAEAQGDNSKQGSCGEATQADAVATPPPPPPAAAAPAVAVLPMGTGNDFARTVGVLGKDPLAALLAALHRPATLIGVCRLTCQTEAGDQTVRRYFLNICCCGVSANAARHLPGLRRYGSTLAYVLAGARALLSYRCLPARLRMDDSSEWQELQGLLLVAAGQGRYFAGGMQILPGADPTSNMLRVASLDGLGLPQFIIYQGRLRRGDIEGIKGVSLYSGTRLELCLALDPLGSVSGSAGVQGAEAGCNDSRQARQQLQRQHQEQRQERARRQLSVECDGEVVGCAPLTVEVLPDAIRFCF